MKVEIFTDGAARGNPGPAGIGVVIKQREKTLLTLGDYIGPATNNVAEYTAFIRGLQEALALGAFEAHAYADSELLVKQVHGVYRVKNENLKSLYCLAANLIKKFKHFKISHVRREKNELADQLANQGLDLKRPVKGK